MTHAHNHRKPVVDRGIKSLAASVLLLAALFLWNQLHVGSCLALGLPTLACLTACYGIFTYRLERKRFALMYWLDPGSSLHALLKRHGMIAVIRASCERRVRPSFCLRRRGERGSADGT